MKTSILLTSLLLTAGFTNAEALKDFTHESAVDRDARMAWFREARFGMFIHWGVYSVPAGEWNGQKNYGEWFLEETKMPVSEYEKFATQFNPVKFDAKAWVRMAKDAGMKYIVITSKHHDGFAMFRSPSSDWGIKNTPFQRDPMKELAEACTAAGIKLCFYHSIMDWHHPDWGTRRKWNDKATGDPDMDRYTDYMKGQLKELLTGYGPIGILWFDGEWEKPWTHERGVDLYNYVRSLQPSIIVNNRVGKGRAGMGGMDKGRGVGDYGTPEQEIPANGFGPGLDWESCMTMNNHWGYNKNDQHWKSTQTLVRNLIDCASKGGNYLLNIGPTSEGLFPQASIDRLGEIGKWMKVNCDSIYGTTANPFKKTPWGRATQRGSTVYLHVYDWPTDGRLEVPLKNKAKSATLLADRGIKITVTANDSSIQLSLPKQALDPIATVIALQLEGNPEVGESAATLAHAQPLVLDASEATVGGNSIQLEKKEGMKDESIGFWTDPADMVKWKVRVSEPGTYRVEALYALDPGSDGSKVELVLGGAKCEAKLAATDGWGAFKTVTLGELNIAKAGTFDLIVKPVEMPGDAVMNLGKLTLTAKP